MAVYAARPSGHSGKTHRNKNNGWKWTRGRYPGTSSFFSISRNLQTPGASGHFGRPRRPPNCSAGSVRAAVEIRSAAACCYPPRPIHPPTSLSPLLKTVAIFFFEQREGARAPLAPAIKMSSAFCKWRFFPRRFRRAESVRRKERVRRGKHGAEG